MGASKAKSGRMAGEILAVGAAQRTTSVPDGTDQNGADYMSKLTPDQLAAKVESDHNRAEQWKKEGADFVTKINTTRAEDYRPPNWRPEWENQGPFGKPLSSLTPEQLAARSNRRAGQSQLGYSLQKETPKFQGYPGQSGNIVSGPRMPLP
jgi:hypothetical protein